MNTDVKLPPAPAGRPKAAPRTPHAAAKRRGPPPWVRLLAWTTLAAWWVYLWTQFSGVTDKAPPEARPAPDPAAETAPAEQEPPAAEPPPPRPPPAAAPAEETVTAAHAKRFEETCAAVAALLVEDNPGLVRRRLLAASASAPPGTASRYKGLVETVNRILATDALVAGALADAVGHQITIHIGEVERTVIPRSVAGTDIEADLVTRNNGETERRPVTFSVLELAPAERARLLGAADTAAKAAAKCLLYRQAGDLESARAAAREAGALAEGLQAALAASPRGAAGGPQP